MTGIIAQRLIRRLCPCRKAAPVTPEFTAQLLLSGIAAPPRVRYTRTVASRIGIYEMLVLDDSIRSATAEGATLFGRSRVPAVCD